MRKIIRRLAVAGFILMLWIVLLFALVNQAFAAPGASLSSMGTPLVAVGTAGGVDSAKVLCPVGQVMTGLRLGTTNSGAVRLEGICANVEPSSFVLTRAAAYTSAVAAATSPTATKEVNCPAQSVLVGWIPEQHISGATLAGATLVCSNFRMTVVAVQLGSPLAVTGNQIGFSGVALPASVCTSNQIVGGFVAGTDTTLRAIRLICHDVIPHWLNVTFEASPAPADYTQFGMSLTGAGIAAPVVSGAKARISTYLMTPGTYAATPTFPGSYVLDSNGCASVSISAGLPDASCTVRLKPAPPDLALEVTNVAPLYAGERGTYAVKVQNKSLASATSAQVRIYMPSSVKSSTVNAPNWTCQGTGTTGVCDVKPASPPLTAASPGNLGFSVLPGLSDVNANAVMRISIGKDGGAAPDPATCSVDGVYCIATAGVRVQPGVALEITAQGSGAPFTVGTSSLSSFQVTNTGVSIATNARLKVQLPAGMKFNSAMLSLWSCVETGGLVDCTATGDIAANGGTRSIPLNITPQASMANMPATLYAAVDKRNGVPPNPTAPCNAPLCATIAGGNVDSGIRLSVAYDPGALSLTVGKSASIDVTVNNAGSADAVASGIKFRLPAGLRFDAALPPTLMTCGLPTNSIYSCTLTDRVGPRNKLTPTIHVIPESPLANSPATLYASVNEAGGGPVTLDPGAACNTPGVCASKLVPKVDDGNDFKIRLDSPVPALAVGKQSIYKITLTNEGSGTATGATFKFRVPATLIYKSVSQAADWNCIASASGPPGELVTCVARKDIAGGGTLDASLVVAPTASAGGTPATVFAGADRSGTASGFDPGVSCNAPAICVNHLSSSVGSDVELGISFLRPGPLYELGVIASQDMVLSNTGLSAVSSANVKIQLPSGLQLDSTLPSEFACQGTTGALDCKYTGSVTQNQSPTVTLKLKADTNLIAAETIYASIDEQAAPAPAGCASTVACASIGTGAVDSGVNLSVDFDARPLALSVGNVTRVELKIRNAAHGTAKNVAIRFLLPAGLELDSKSRSSTLDCTPPSAGFIDCKVGPDIPPTGEATVSLDVMPQPSLVGRSATIFAAIESNGAAVTRQPGASCNSAGICAQKSTGTTGNGADLLMALSGPAPELKVAQESMYSVTVANQGPGSLIGTAVKIQLPDELLLKAISPLWSCVLDAPLVRTCTYESDLGPAHSQTELDLQVQPTSAASGKPMTVRVALSPSNDLAAIDMSGPCATPVCGVVTSAPVQDDVQLTIAFVPPAPSYEVGRQSTQSVTLANMGLNPAMDPRFRIRLPSGLTLIDAAPAGKIACPEVTDQIECIYSGAVVQGEPITIDLHLSPSATMQPAQNLDASVDAHNSAPPMPGPTCTDAATCSSIGAGIVHSGVRLKVQLDQAPLSMVVGKGDAVGVTITNLGGGIKSRPPIDFKLPDGLALDTESPSQGLTCDPLVGGATSCRLDAEVPANGSATAMLHLVPQASMANVSGAIYAAIDASGGPVSLPPGPSCNDPDLCAQKSTNTVREGSDLFVSIAGPTPALTVAKTATYDVTLENRGTGPSRGAKFKLKLPDELAYKSVSSGATCAAPINGVITCELESSLNAPEVRSSSITVEPNADAGGKNVVVHAGVHAANDIQAVDPGAACVTPVRCASSALATIASSVESLPEARLQIAWRRPLPDLHVGGQASYVLQVMNDGLGDAATPTVEILLANGIQFDSAVGENWSCASVVSTVICTHVGALRTGESSTFELFVLPTVSTATENVIQYASIDPTGMGAPPAAGPGCTNKPHCASTSPVSIERDADVSIRMNGPTPALRVGARSIYHAVVTSTGGSRIEDASVRMLMPDGMEFVAVTTPGWSCTSEAALLVCKNAGAGTGSARASSDMTTDIEFVVMPRASLGNSQYVQYSAVALSGSVSADPVPGPSCAPASRCSQSETSRVTSGEDGLIVTKSVGAKRVEIGDTVSYRIAVKNLSSGVATSVAVQDSLPVGFRLVERTARIIRGSVSSPIDSFRPQGSIQKFEIGDLLAGATAEIEYRLRVGAGAKVGVASNSAQASSVSGLLSSVAIAKVEVTAGVFGEDGCIAGKVFVDVNGDGVQSDGEPGIARAKIYLQNGMHFTTDWAGRYSFCGVKSRSNVVKLDRRSVPSGCTPKILGNNNMGDASSIFLGASNGHLQRGDFAVTQCSAAALNEIEKRNLLANEKRGR